MRWCNIYSQKEQEELKKISFSTAKVLKKKNDRLIIGVYLLSR